MSGQRAHCNSSCKLDLPAPRGTLGSRRTRMPYLNPPTLTRDEQRALLEASADYLTLTSVRVSENPPASSR